jgi:hypothetical protein
MMIYLMLSLRVAFGVLQCALVDTLRWDKLAQIDVVSGSMKPPLPSSRPKPWRLRTKLWLC